MDKSLEAGQTQQAFGWAARDASGQLSPFSFSRRSTGENDITVKILYCGICHTDLHFLKNDHGISLYPLVPGHEIVGVAVEVGRNVRKFRVGNMVGVGGYVGSCNNCDNCLNDLEPYCPELIFTISGVDPRDGAATQGGYSDIIVVDERYAVRFPEGLSPAAGAPLLCAGITVYSPLRHFGLDKPGMSLGVVGLGGLGHVAVKFGKAFGMRVTVISRSPAKEAAAVGQLGADAFLISSSEEQMQAATGSMDGIIDTVSAGHPVAPLIKLLKAQGKLVLVGATEKPLEVPPLPLLMGRRLVAGSAGGGMKETQEMIDFAANHNITADIELIPINYVNTAMERLARGDVQYRFVIDVANTLAMA